MGNQIADYDERTLRKVLDMADDLLERQADIVAKRGPAGAISAAGIAHEAINRFCREILDLLHDQQRRALNRGGP